MHERVLFPLCCYFITATGQKPNEFDFLILLCNPNDGSLMWQREGGSRRS